MINLKNKAIFVLFALVLFFFGFNVAYAGTSHAVIGYVADSLDGTEANGAIVTMYVDSRPTETLTDTIGPTGNSGNDNWYNIDIGNFPTPWSPGEIIEIEVTKDSSHQVSTSLTLTSAGVDQASDMILPGSSSTSTGGGSSGGGYSVFVIDFRTKQEYSPVYLSQVTPVTMILSDGKIFYVYYSIINNEDYIKITRSLQYATQNFEEGNDLNKQFLIQLNNIKKLNIVDGSENEIEIELISIDTTRKFRFKELNETQQEITQEQETQQPEEPKQEKPQEITQEQETQQPEQPQETQIEKQSVFVSFFKNNWKKIILVIVLILLVLLIFESFRKIFLIVSKKKKEKEQKEMDKNPIQTISQPTTIQQRTQQIKQQKEKISETKTKEEPQPQLKQSKKITQTSFFKEDNKNQKYKKEREYKEHKTFSLSTLFKKEKTKILNTEFMQKLKLIDEDEKRLKEINKKIKELDKKLK